jgi:copper transport protein
LLVAFRGQPGLRPAALGATGLAVPRRVLAPAVGVMLFVPVAFLVLVPVFAGHADTQSPRALLIPSVLAHVIAMGLWAGGIAMLLAVVPVATRRLEPPERTALLTAALGRFSAMALACVGVILVSGLIQFLVLVRAPAHLIDTAYGRSVSIKIVLLALLIGLGAYNRRRTVPALARAARDGGSPGHAGLLLRRALRFEVVLLVAVLAVTAALASYAPAVSAEQAGPVNRKAAVGPARLELTVDPARVGSNQIHLYLTNPRDGSQYRGAKEVGVDASLPSKSIGPLAEPATKAGPGHYVVAGALFGVKGDWRLKVTVRVSKFDQYEASVTAPIR